MKTGTLPYIIYSIVLVSYSNAFSRPGKFSKSQTITFNSRHVPILRSVSNESDGEQKKTLPQLPPPSGKVRAKDSLKEKPFVASKKFQMSYTCKICGERNTHMVSRIAYNNGVVIVTCKGCGNQHMIADNLGWSNHPGGFEDSDTIEDFMEKKGDGENVSRVNHDVWDLERLLDESGGAFE